jgi:hypothetical protein
MSVLSISQQIVNRHVQSFSQLAHRLQRRGVPPSFEAAKVAPVHPDLSGKLNLSEPDSFSQDLYSFWQCFEVVLHLISLA